MLTKLDIIIPVKNKQDQGSKAPSTSPFSQIKIEPPMYSKHFVSIPRVLELVWSYKSANTELLKSYTQAY